MITHSNQIELRHYRYFQALAEELNYHRAAEKLFISQPGLSRQIKQMENLLGVTLFHRDQRNVTLTPAGKYLQQEASYMLNYLQAVHRHLKQIHLGEGGELRIGFLGSAMQKVIPEILLYLKNHHPEIHTTLQEMSNQDQVEHLMSDKIDIGFVRLPHVPDPLCQKDVYQDRFTLVLPDAHPLSKETFKSLSQVKNEQFILFSSDYSPHYFDTIISLFKEVGYTPTISHKSVHAQTIFKLVEQGLGLAIVPHSLQYGFDLNIKFIDIPNVTQRTTLSAIWNGQNTNPCFVHMHSAIEALYESA